MLYRTIKTDTWRDPWFHALKPESKCLFLYLFTNPVISACGSMEISMGQVAFDVGMPVKKVEAEIASFGDKVLWIPESSILVVRNFFRHQRSQSSANYTIAAKRAMDALPEKARVWLISANPELKDTHPHPIPIPSPSQGDKGKEEEEDKGKGKEEGKESIPPLPPEGESQTPPKRKHRLPDDWTPSDSQRASLADSGFSVQEIDVETVKFKNYHLNKGDTGLAWNLAFANWMQNSRSFAKPNGAKAFSPYPFTREEELAAIAANPLLRVVGND